MSAKKRDSELRAGAFLLVGVVVLTAAIFLLGKKSALFSRTTDLFVNFEDSSGLVEGAEVRLAGLEVGTVRAISFPQDLKRKEARVRLVVQTKFMERIRADSQAFIDSKGLLGDKVVNISIGDPSAATLGEGATLKTGKTASFESIAANVGQAVESVAHISEAVEEVVVDERLPRLQADLSRVAASLAGILAEVEHGSGLVHRLIYDPSYGDNAQAILAETRAVAEKANRATARIDAILAEVEQGDGTMHELVYGEDGRRALASLGLAADEIKDVVREVKQGHGVLHTLVYEEGHTNFLRELNEMSVTLNRIVSDIDKGRGTLGGLLRDPTVYEDLKTLLGKVKRNVLFKALVRFTIEEDGLRRAEEAPSVSSHAAGVATKPALRRPTRHPGKAARTR
jgi:phospholipid/cholesterol/gamma-HCH transport system substrate-binding protein